jgi:hypothetical protein
MVFSPASRLWRLAVENTFVDAANKMLETNILLAASEEKSHNSEPPKARCWRDFNYLNMIFYEICQITKNLIVRIWTNQ